MQKSKELCIKICFLLRQYAKEYSLGYIYTATVTRKLTTPEIFGPKCMECALAPLRKIPCATPAHIPYMSSIIYLGIVSIIQTQFIAKLIQNTIYLGFFENVSTRRPKVQSMLPTLEILINAWGFTFVA